MNNQIIELMCQNYITLTERAIALEKIIEEIESDESKVSLNTLIMKINELKDKLSEKTSADVNETIKTLTELIDDWGESLPTELDENFTLKYGLTIESFKDIQKAASAIDNNPDKLAQLITSDTSQIMSDDIKHIFDALAKIGFTYKLKETNKSGYDVTDTKYTDNFKSDITFKELGLTIKDVRLIKTYIERQLTYLETKPHERLIKNAYETAKVVFDEIANLDKDSVDYLTSKANNAIKLSRVYLFFELFKIAFSKLNKDAYIVNASMIKEISTNIDEPIDDDTSDEELDVTNEE